MADDSSFFLLHLSFYLYLNSQMSCSQAILHQDVLSVCMQPGQQCSVSCMKRSHSTQNTFLHARQINTCREEKKQVECYFKQQTYLMFAYKRFEIEKPTLLSFNSPWQASQNLKRHRLTLWNRLKRDRPITKWWWRLLLSLILLQRGLLESVQGEEVVEGTGQVRSRN